MGLTIHFFVMRNASRRVHKAEPTNADLQQAILENLEAIQKNERIMQDNQQATQEVRSTLENFQEETTKSFNEVLNRMDRFIVLQENHKAEIVALRDADHHLDKRVTRLEVAKSR